MREMVDEGYTCMQLDIMGHINDYTRDLIDKYRLANYVGCAGSFPYLEAVTRLLDYDVLVLLEARLQRGIFFASKFTDYAQSTRPILAVSPKEGFAHDMITQYGGVCVDNEDYRDIKRGLLELYKAWEADTLDSTYSTQRLYAEFSTQKVVDIYNTLKEYTNNITVYDPWADASQVKKEYAITTYDGTYDTLKGRYDAVILCVAHNEFEGKDVRELLADRITGVVYDVKGVLNRELIDGRL
jgi:hypothetical protein